MVFCIVFLICDMNNEIFSIFENVRFFTPIFAFFCWRQQKTKNAISRERIDRFSRFFYTSFLLIICRGWSNSFLKFSIEMVLWAKTQKIKFWVPTALWLKILTGRIFKISKIHWTIPWKYPYVSCVKKSAQLNGYFLSYRVFRLGNSQKRKTEKNAFKVNIYEFSVSYNITKIQLWLVFFTIKQFIMLVYAKLTSQYWF